MNPSAAKCIKRYLCDTKMASVCVAQGATVRWLSREMTDVKMMYVMSRHCMLCFLLNKPKSKEKAVYQSPGGRQSTNKHSV